MNGARNTPVDTPIGFGRHIESITSLLLIGENGEPRATVAVTGESGVGKTTAVREVIHGLAVQRHFDVCAWVCLPAQSRAERYLDQIREQAQVQTHWNFSRRGEAVTQVLDRMKLLVVLDGMDSMDELVDVVRKMPNGAEGSRIVITTRLSSDEIVEKLPDKRIRPVKIDCLGRDDCLELLQSRLFSSSSRQVYERHHGVFADKVFDISEGLPLAVVLLAGLLYFKDRKTQWDEAFTLLGSCEHMRKIKRILAVSYATMPLVLRLCLLYFAAMPPNVSLDVDRLERLWSADGIQESHRQQVFETDHGLLRCCIDALSSRGLLQATESSSPGKVCINKEVQSFACERASQAGFMEDHKQFLINGSSTVRGLSVQNHGESHVRMGDPCFPKLRILLAHLAEENGTAADRGDHPPPHGKAQASRLGFLRHSHYLRILDLQCACLGKLPDSVGDMIHLRYLGLRSCCLTELPKTVAKLLNLETLDITDNDIEEVDDEFWNINKLKNVLAKKIRLPSSADSIASGANLETLHGVVLSPPSPTQGDVFPLNTMHKLFSLALVGVKETHAPALANALRGIRSVKRIRIAGDCVPLIFPPKEVHSLELDGNIIGAQTVPTDQLSTSKLVLRSSGLSQALVDSFLAKAYIVELELLDNAFTGQWLLLRRNEFLGLEKLKLGNLQVLEELVIEEQPRLTTIQMFGCPKVKTIRRLNNSGSLENVLLYDMPEPVANIQAEDKVLFGKIKHVISAAWACTTS